LEPRKIPVQARSAASVEAILHATIQVLLKLGKERLTTTAVALRAGVSVGTLYQYFPNKTVLLHAALQRHSDEIELAIETVCREQSGKSLESMAAGLVTSFLRAKMRDPKTSIPPYSVSSDVDGAQIVRGMAARASQAVIAMLKTAQEELTTDPELVCSMLQAMMAGVSRRLLESPTPEKDCEKMLNELAFLASTYLRACSRARAHSSSEYAS
jgi:AcrR family transcriptional regulator